MNDKIIYKGIHNNQKDFKFKFVLEKLTCEIKKADSFELFIEGHPFEDFMIKKAKTGVMNQKNDEDKKGR